MPRPQYPGDSLSPETLAHYFRQLGAEGLAARHGINLRTAQRLCAGKQPCPNRLRDEIALHLQDQQS